MRYLEIKTAKQAARLARDLKKRKHRELTNRFLIEGVNFVEDALISRTELDYLLPASLMLMRSSISGGCLM